jgi:UDP-GlcNAc:undecaprenyl-phosphate GlcNAc-1-phosphate transferase
MPAAGTILVVGLVDDLRELKPWRKIICEIGAAVLAYSAGVHFKGIAGHEIAPWLSLPITIAWLLICTNAVNLIDGIDGLATGVGLFATTTMVLAALMQGNVPLAIAVVPLAGALLGFLRYNFNPATIFLGDSGSLLIGFLLGCYGILWSQKSATLLGMTAPLMALAIPLLDTLLAILRRFVHNKPIFTADRGHIHHRLLDRGMTPRKAALLLYGCCAIGAICSLGMNTNLSGIVLVIFCAVTWIGVQQLGYVEFGTAGRMFIDGDFRRQLSSQVAIQSFADQLRSADTVDDCWAIISRTSREFGFPYVALCLAGQFFEQGHGGDLDQYWILRVPLSGADFIEVAREFGQTDYCPVISSFVEALRKSLAPKFASFSVHETTMSAKSFA